MIAFHRKKRVFGGKEKHALRLCNVHVIIYARIFTCRSVLLPLLHPSTFHSIDSHTICAFRVREVIVCSYRQMRWLLAHSEWANEVITFFIAMKGNERGKKSVQMGNKRQNQRKKERKITQMVKEPKRKQNVARKEIKKKGCVRQEKLSDFLFLSFLLSHD